MLRLWKEDNKEEKEKASGTEWKEGEREYKKINCEKKKEKKSKRKEERTMITRKREKRNCCG